MRIVIFATAAFTLLMCACLALSVSAAKLSVETLDAKKFHALDAGSLQTGKLYYTGGVSAFPDWTAASPAASQNLVLFPGYKEPTVIVSKNGIEKQDVEKLVVFVGIAKNVLNKAPGQIDIAKVIRKDVVDGFDTEIEHIEIKPDQLMPNVVASKQPINSFQWCNKNGPDIVRQLREKDLSANQNPKRPWCPADGRTICLESCYIFGTFWHEGVGAANLMYEEKDKKDYGIASQSELKYFTDEKELGLPVPLAKLTGIKTPVRGGLQQSLIYFNQVMQFGKVIVVLQDSPSNPNQTVMTTYFVIGLKKRTWDSFGEIRDILMGESMMFNTSTGITAGLPVYSQNTIKAMAGALEN